jgi:hypothetical protein
VAGFGSALCLLAVILGQAMIASLKAIGRSVSAIFPRRGCSQRASSTEGNRYRTTGVHQTASVITSYADENAILEVPMTTSTTTFCRPCWIDCQLYILRRRPEHLSIPDADNDWTFIVQLKADRSIKTCRVGEIDVSSASDHG